MVRALTSLSSVALKENGRRQKTMVCEKFDQLYSVLEEKKRDMSQKVTEEQEEKLNYIRGLTRKYGDHLERSCKVVEMGIQTVEEPEMALFLQVRLGRVNALPIFNFSYNLVSFLPLRTQSRCLKREYVFYALTTEHLESIFASFCVPGDDLTSFTR